MDNGAITCIFGNVPKAIPSVQVAGEETEARVGILNMAEDTKCRRVLALILHNRKQVFGYEWEFVDRMTVLYTRNFTVAEAAKIYQIKGRFR